MLLKQNSQTKIGLSRINQSTIINLIGIKCAQCNLIYTRQMIEEHLISHIQPKFLMPYQQRTGAKKLKSRVQLTEQTLSIKSSDATSLNYETFPQSQILRKDIKPPSEFGMIVHDIPKIQKDIISYRNDDIDLSSAIAVKLQKDEVERQRLMHGVGLQREETILGGRQEISLYRNKKGQGLPMTLRIKTEKKINPYEQSSTQSEKTKQYELLPIKEDLIHLKGQQPIEDRNLLVVNVRKHKQLTPRYESIITTSAKKAQQYQQQSTASKLYTPNKFQPSAINHFDLTTNLQTSQSRFNHTHISSTNQFQCQQCHGFYCQHCKSTIPPIYRPWNINDIDPKIVQFYKQHVYKKNCQNCDNNLK